MSDSTSKFTGKADGYARHRPAYPEGALDYISSLADKKFMIADIGAGTGIFTRQLLQRGYSVAAVEPNADMRKKAEQELQGFAGFLSLNATAEDTKLAAQSIGLVTAAQSFHWFDQEKFRLECVRILRPGGTAVLLWNSRDPQSPMVEELAEICRQFCPAFKGFSGGRTDEWDEWFRRFFQDGKYVHRRFSHPLPFDRNGFIGRAMSASYAPDETMAGPFMEAVGTVFDRYQVVGMAMLPNQTDVYAGKVRTDELYTDYSV